MSAREPRPRGAGSVYGGNQKQLQESRERRIVPIVPHTRTGAMASQLMKLLQVEDDPNEVYFFQWVVRRWNVPLMAQVAPTGALALELLDIGCATGSPPDLLLLDINLPQMSGFDVLAALKKRPEWRRLPAVMFSNSSHPADVQRARELGAQAYVVKPNVPTVLADILKSLHAHWERGEVLNVWPNELLPDIHSPAPTQTHLNLIRP